MSKLFFGLKGDVKKTLVLQIVTAGGIQSKFSKVFRYP